MRIQRGERLAVPIYLYVCVCFASRNLTSDRAPSAVHDPAYPGKCFLLLLPSGFAAGAGR